MPRSYQTSVKTEQTSQTSITPTALKVEQTSQTYGQHIVATSQQLQSVTSPQTTQVLQGSINQLQSVSTADIVNVAAQAALTSQPVLLTPDMISVTAVPALMSIFQSIVVNPIDTLVKVISNTPEASEVLGCREKATISMAAASANKNATVAVRSDILVQRKPQSLQGSILNNIATVIPNVVKFVTVVGSAVKSKEEIKKALSEAQKIDLSITLHSKRSESLEFNHLKKPRFEVDFVYNFFIEEEEDVESQEDQKLDPLLKKRPVDTPRYGNLMWTVTQVTEPLAGTEEEVKKNEILRRNAFVKPKGQFAVSTHSVPFSTQKRKKDMNPFIKDGLQRKIVDIHDPERFFSAVANDDEFANSISITLNISNQRRVISTLPYSNINK